MCAHPDEHRLAPARRQVLEAIASMIPPAAGPDCVLVGVDGIDGSGKTTFADELAAVVMASGRPAVRISVDDFHNTRSVRYRRGRTSPEGFWLDSFNYARLRRDVLEPLGPHGSRAYRQMAHDLATDATVEAQPRIAPPGSVAVLDGLFLHRDELAPCWRFSVFLDVPFEVTARRMADRDGTNPDPAHPSMRRYVGAQLLYFAACDPRSRATVVVDNTDPAAPRIR